MRPHRRRPAWLPGLVAVAAVAVGGLALAACGIPTDAAPKPLPASDVPLHLLTPTTASPGTTRPPTVGVAATIYLVGTDQHVTPATRIVSPPANLTQTLGALMEGPTAAESAAGLQSFLSGERSNVSASTTAGVATVDFTTNPAAVVGPDQVLAIAQVVFTATEQPGVTGVLFQIAGKPIEVPTSSGAQVAGPVTRADYATVAPS
jgi:spore germination protein GerM